MEIATQQQPKGLGCWMPIRRGLDQNWGWDSNAGTERGWPSQVASPRRYHHLPVIPRKHPADICLKLADLHKASHATDLGEYELTTVLTCYILV